MNKDTIIFFDIDYTLFDTARFQEKLFRSIARVLAIDVSKVAWLHEKVVENLAVAKGFFDPAMYAKLMAQEIGDEKKEMVILDALQQDGNFLDNYYEETVEVIKYIAGKVIIGIFSKGETTFQKRKLKDIEHFFSMYYMHITIDKHKALPELLNAYPEETLYFVDDALDVLHKAKMLRNDVKTIWVKRGKYAQKQAPIEGFTPNAIIENLRELLPIVVKDKE